MTANDIVNILRVLKAAYPHVETTDDMHELWLNGFADNGVSQVALAARTWVETEQYFPTIADIRTKMRQAAQREARELSWTRRPDPTEKFLSFEEGRAVAAIAYERDCAEQGKEPRWEVWNRMMGLYGPAPQRPVYR